MPRKHLVALAELDLVVLHDLDAVAKRIDEIEAAAGEDLDACCFERASRRLLVVDDETEVARAVARLRPALHQRDELIADIDERRVVRATAKLDVEQSAVELERAIDVVDLERDVVDSDEPRLAHERSA